MVSSGKFTRVVILPLSEKDRLSGKEESGWRDPTCCGKVSLQAPCERWTSGNKYFLTHCGFASLSCFLAYLICFRFDLLGVLFVCAGITPCLWLSTKTTHQVWFVLDKEGAWSCFCRVSDRSDRCLVRAELVTGLTSDAWRFKFSGKKV
jgi:hypothetical protein